MGTTGKRGNERNPHFVRAAIAHHERALKDDVLAYQHPTVDEDHTPVSWQPAHVRYRRADANERILNRERNVAPVTPNKNLNRSNRKRKPERIIFGGHQVANPAEALEALEALLPIGPEVTTS
jgi:hypothetical protein